MIFNEEQIEAINHRTGPALILAGPGSGKTAVITGRTLSLIREAKVKPESILVITFTKAAAEEMKQRYLKQASYSENGVCFGTFHAVFFYILRESIGLGNGVLIKPQEQMNLVFSALEDMHPGRVYSREDVRRILSEISRCKNSCGLTPNSKLSHRLNPSANLSCSEEEFRTVFSCYQTFLGREGKMDFDDILSKAYDLLKNNGVIRERWQRKFKYILLDEFQDINLIQYETVKLLAAPENNIFAVGDDDQSIYAFRGAEPGLLDHFLYDYPYAHIVTLKKNYRSAACITRASMSLIRNNSSHRRKNIENLPKKGRVSIRDFEDRRTEYTGLAEELRSLAQKENLSELDETAVLFRTNAQIRGLADTLTERGIPFVLKENIPELAGHFITKDILSYLRLAYGKGQRADCLRICNHPYRGLRRECFIEEDIYNPSYVYRVREQDRVKLSLFFEDINRLKDFDPFGAIFYLRRVLGYEQYLREHAEKENLDFEDLLEILEEVQECAASANTLGEFEEKIKRNYSGHVASRKNEDTGGVKLMTFHASKGLEFKRVYLPDLNEGVAPLKHADAKEMVEEERRVCYVAMTRAKEELTLMYVKKRGGRFIQPSRFILEVQNDYVAKVSAAV